MAQQSERYYGAFCKLVKEDDGDVMTPDQNAIRIGTPLSVTHEVHVTKRGKEYDRVFVTDPVGHDAGFLPKQVANRLVELFDQGWLCHVIPTLVVYSKKDEGYWAEVAIVCYPKELQQPFDAFLTAVCHKIASGNHTDVRLSDEQVDMILSSNGSWSDVANAPLPHIDKESAIYKSKQTGTERLTTTAIEHTTGCYIVLIAATVLVVAFAVWFFFLR